MSIARLLPVIMGGKTSYRQKIINLAPIAYWPLNETSGTAAVNYGSIGVAGNGTLGAGGAAPTLGNVAAPGGGLAPLFDGGDYINIYSAALNTAFSGTLGSMVAWWKVYNAGVWTDGTQRRVILLSSSTPHYVIMTRPTPNNSFRYQIWAPTAVEVIDTSSSTAWNCSVMTWNDSANQLSAYTNNSQIGAAVAFGTWSGTLSATGCLIGANSSVPANPWYGYIAHVAIWDRVLDATERANLYNWGL